MASIHIDDIIRQVQELEKECKEGFFLEIKFDRPDVGSANTVDIPFANKVITTDCSIGNVTIIFDERGQLKSIEIN